jgi:hypothetical protein
MSIIRSVSLGLFALSCASCVAQTGANTTFAIQQKTSVPGGTLQSGEYTIQIVDHLSDRSVVQITSSGKASPVTFLGVGASGSGFTAASGPVLWNKGLKGEKALRGFNFPTGEHLDFVYPKDDAVALANANKEGVVAVDPASEKRPELAKLSPSDLQLVTLWSLTPVTVGPTNVAAKGIEAKRYVPNATSAPAANAPTVAVTETPAPAVTAAVSAPRVQSSPSQSTLVAKLDKPQPVKAVHTTVKRLPQTAGFTPLVGLLAGLSMCSALSLRARRA